MIFFHDCSWVWEKQDEHNELCCGALFEEVSVHVNFIYRVICLTHPPWIPLLLTNTQLKQKVQKKNLMWHQKKPG